MQRNEDMYQFILALLNLIDAVPMLKPILLVFAVVAFISFAAGLAND